MTLVLEFGNFTCCIEVKDPQDLFRDMLTLEGGRWVLVGGRDLSGRPVRGAIRVSNYGERWSFLALTGTTREMEAVFRAALEAALA